MATEIQCPIEGCDYEAGPQSVHAHITASPSGNHAGESGVTWQRTIADRLPNGEQAPWERASNGPDVDQWETLDGDNADNAGSEPETLAEQGNESNGDGKDSPGEPTTDAGPVPGGAGEDAGGSEPLTEGDGDDPVGIPVPFSPTVMVLLVVAGFLVMYYLNTNNSEEAAEDVDEEDQEEEWAGDGGLVA